jgi:hypothetical protein
MPTYVREATVMAELEPRAAGARSTVHYRVLVLFDAEEATMRVNCEGGGAVIDL